VVGALLIVLPGAADSAGVVRDGPVEAQLVSEVTTVRPGEPFTVALRLHMDREWHVYWRNPGDAGLAPAITWQLPEGFTAGEIQWPHPARISTPPITCYGYDDEVLLLVEITPPRGLEPGTTAVLRATAEWLACREVCVAGEAELAVSLPVVDAPPARDQEWAGRFDEARRRLPLRSSGWQVAASLGGGTIVLELTPPAGFSGRLGRVLFFPFDDALIANGTAQELARDGARYRLTVERWPNRLDDPERIAGVLVSSSGWGGPDSRKAIEFDAIVGGDGPQSSITEERRRD
jgi:DsbC/DsbD-like thiol-disulfide interchange protein